MAAAWELRVLGPDAAGEKLLTRALYEEAFGDSARFTDYYYSEKCIDNRMVVLSENGRPLSMLHLNPYTLSVSGRTARAYYIVAVATKRNRRRQGCMRLVLQRAFAEMEREGIPFCYLLPRDEAIYTPFGFETICDFVPPTHPLSHLPYETVRKQYTLYCVQDTHYLRRRAMEEEIAAGEGEADEALPEKPVIMAKIIDAKACAALLGERDEAPAVLLERLRGQRCYFREEV